jgi:class 3 adenylate cyclase
MNSRERVERRLAAILAADVAVYSRLMGKDEEGTHAALTAVRREVSDPKDRRAPRADRQNHWRRLACRVRQRR